MNGPNTKGYAMTQNGNLLLNIEYVDPQTRFYFCIDLLGHHYRIHHTDFKPMPTIPSRMREYVFHDLAHIWAEALNAFPHNITIDPSPLNSESFVKKLRDSREAKNKYGWKHPLVDEEKWKTLSNDISLSYDGSMITMGSRHARREAKALGKIIAKDQILVDNKGLEQLCLLLHNRFFNPKPSFLVKDISSEQIANYEARYDVGFIPTDKENEYIL